MRSVSSFRPLSVMLLILIVFVLTALPSSAVVIRIVESQSYMPGHDMDVEWLDVVQDMGIDSVEIVPQSFLDGDSWYDDVDLLIVSSGVIDIPQNRKDTIQGFLEAGKSVYLQAEYDALYSSNQRFMEIVNDTGGDFEWGQTVQGDLVPTVISGAISESPHEVTELDYHWWGCTADPDSNVVPHFTYDNQPLGWSYSVESVDRGASTILTSTDQDWVRARSNTMLMENIIVHLSGATTDEPVDLEVISAPQPIQIPDQGGMLTVGARIINPGLVAWTGGAWTMVVLPSGWEYGPLLTVSDLTVPAGTTTAWHALEQGIPGFAPPGEYHYQVHIGELDDFASDDSEAVVFVKAAGTGFGEGAMPGWPRTALSGLTTVSAFPQPANTPGEISAEEAAAFVPPLVR